MRLGLVIGCLALVATGCMSEQADAKRRYSFSSAKKRSGRVRSLSGYGARGTTDGPCPCNGGNVCVGPRGGRYCITSGGNKRYGV